LKSPNLSKASMIRYSLHELNRIGDKRHSCPTPLPAFTLLVFPWSGFSLTLWYMHSCCSLFFRAYRYQISFRVCINLIQFTLANAFCPSLKRAHARAHTHTHTQSSSCVFRVNSDIIIRIPTASVVSFSLPNPNWFSASTSSVFLPILPVYLCMCGEADCAVAVAFCSIWLSLLRQSL
jgi:hypothetical protein